MKTNPLNKESSILQICIKKILNSTLCKYFKNYILNIDIGIKTIPTKHNNL